MKFKPMLVKNGQDFEWRRSPLQKVKDKQEVLAALQEAKKFDFWFRLRTIKKSFPFSINFLRLASNVSRSRHTIHERPCQNEEIKARMSFLLSNLGSHSRKYDYTAVVLFIPMSGELRIRKNGGKCGCSPFIEEIQGLDIAKDLVIVNVCEKKFDERLFFIKDFMGHASSYGNRMIAEAVYEKLQARLLTQQ